MIWETKGNKVFCGLCRHFSVVHEVIGGVPVFVCSVIKISVVSCRLHKFIKWIKFHP